VFVEIDEIAIREDLLKRIKLGDEAALQEARQSLNGTHLYMHALSIEGGIEEWRTISIYEAHHLGIIKSVVLQCS
jgi:hypothetical protein